MGLGEPCSPKPRGEVLAPFSLVDTAKQCGEDRLGAQERAKRRRRSWEVDAYLRSLVARVGILVEDLERLLEPILPELCRLAKEFSGLPEPRLGSARVRARGREYEYPVLYLLESEGGGFAGARKVYLVSDERRELAARYGELYRRVADLLRAARSYCLGLEAQELSKRSEPQLLDDGF